MNQIAFIVLVAAASLCATVHAESLRCNGDLAQVGDAKASVLQKCGTPVFVESFCKPVNQAVLLPTAPGTTTVNVMPCELVEEWSYNPGPGQFITILRFEAGVMTAIRYGDRVR